MLPIRWEFRTGMDYGQPKLDQSEEAGRQARDTEARKKHGGKQETQRPARDVEKSKRHGEKEEDPPGAEGTVKVQKWRKKQDREGS